jgi:hypothetical protein
MAIKFVTRGERAGFTRSASWPRPPRLDGCAGLAGTTVQNSGRSRRQTRAAPPPGESEHHLGVDTAQRVWGRRLAWALAVVAMGLSLSGWFMLFGLAVSLPAMVLARQSGTRRAFILAAAATAISLAWLTIDRLVA